MPIQRSFYFYNVHNNRKKPSDKNTFDNIIFWSFCNKNSCTNILLQSFKLNR